MFADFFFIRKKQWVEIKGWNWMATIAVVAAVMIGYYFQYVNPMGLPSVLSLFVSIVVYLIAMKVKKQVAPDQFTGNNLTN